MKCVLCWTRPVRFFFRFICVIEATIYFSAHTTRVCGLIIPGCESITTGWRVGPIFLKRFREPFVCLVCVRDLIRPRVYIGKKNFFNKAKHAIKMATTSWSPFEFFNFLGGSWIKKKGKRNATGWRRSPLWFLRIVFIFQIKNFWSFENVTIRDVIAQSEMSNAKIEIVIERYLELIQN